MKNNLWEAAKSWIQSISLLTIHKSYLLKATVQKLRAISAGINQKYGLCICKAMFGKTYSYMRKQEIVNAIMHVKVHLLILFNNKVQTKYITKRITEIISAEGECAYVFQFDNKFDAWKFYYWISSRSSFLIFKEQGIYYEKQPEVYVLNIFPDILEKLVKKELDSCQASSLEFEKFKAYEKIYKESPGTFQKLPAWLQQKIKTFVEQKETTVQLEPLEGF